MTLETGISFFGLVISLGGLVAAGITRQAGLAIFACALIGSTGLASWRAFTHGQEVSRVENELRVRLANNRWTLERIYSEMRQPNYTVLREALTQAVDDKMVGDERMDCTVNDGSVLTTRVYFNIANQ